MSELKKFKISSLLSELTLFYVMGVSCVLLAFFQPSIFYAFNWQSGMDVKFSLQISAILVAFVAFLMSFVGFFRESDISKARIQIREALEFEMVRFKEAKSTAHTKESVKILCDYPRIKDHLNSYLISIRNFKRVVNFVRWHSIVIFSISTLFFLYSAG